MAAYSIPALPLNLCYRATESTLAPTGNYYYFIFVTAVNKPMGVTASGRREIFNNALQEKQTQLVLPVVRCYSQIYSTQQGHFD